MYTSCSRTDSYMRTMSSPASFFVTLDRPRGTPSLDACVLVSRVLPCTTYRLHMRLASSGWLEPRHKLRSIVARTTKNFNVCQCAHGPDRWSLSKRWGKKCGYSPLAPSSLPLNKKKICSVRQWLSHKSPIVTHSHWPGSISQHAQSIRKNFKIWKKFDCRRVWTKFCGRSIYPMKDQLALP